jgi:hypothetical protein
MFQVLPLQTNLKDAYQKGTDDEQKFIQNLSLFLCTFLKEQHVEKIIFSTFLVFFQEIIKEQKNC